MNKDQFKNPDPIYRPAPFWSWNDKLDKEELERQIQEMADKGWGSYFMHSRVGLVTEYLSDEWMELVTACAEKAKETNTYAWLYDEDKWPSGFAGGEVAKHKEYRSRALVLLKEDQITTDDTILTEYHHNQESLFICKRISPLGNTWFNGTSYVDLMNPKAVKAFLEATHEKYKESCSEYFGKEIPGIFTDEPCYLMENHYDVPVLPWSDYLADYFKALNNYNIEDYLIELFFDINDYQKVRYDFFNTATQLFLESFTKQYYAWCEENNLKMTGHFMAEDNLTYQTQWIGAAMPHYEFMHWPGIDKLGRHLEQLVTVKQVTSVADQLGKERSFSEVFGCVGQQVSFYHRKWIADWQAALGISFVNHHLSLYSMRGERKRDYPANLYYQQPWWDNEKEFADYIGRLSYAVAEGKREVDILVIHPVSSVWCEYSPLHKKNNLMLEQEIYDRPFAELSKILMESKLDFHYGDEIIMENHARVEDGKLIIGEHSYSKVIIPPTLTLKSNTIKLLIEFSQSTEKENLIIMEPAPSRIDGVTTPISWPENTLQVDTVSKVTKKLDEIYSDRIKIINQFTADNAKEIYCHQRTSDSGDWYLLVNTAENREISTEISILTDKETLIFDLSNGKKYTTNSTSNSRDIIKNNSKGNNKYNTKKLKVKFYPAGSLLLYLPNDKTANNSNIDTLPQFINSGIEFIDYQQAESKQNKEKTSLSLSKMEESQTIEKWQIKLQEDNVLPLKDVTLFLDGKEVLKNQPINKAWHQHFYQTEEGTPFKAIYQFEIQEQPDENTYAVIEVAENLDKIIVNNQQVSALRDSGEPFRFNDEQIWKDITFTKVPLTGKLKMGINTIIIEGKKENNITGPNTHIPVENFKTHRPTEVETIYIVGDFSVTDYNKTNFLIKGQNSNINAQNLTASGYPFYAGQVEFMTSLKLDNVPEKIYLQVDDVNAACLELYVNEQKVGTSYWEPFLYDISKYLKEGNNQIKLKAATTLFNLMGPNRIDGILESCFVGPRTFIDEENFTEKYTLLPFGIGKGRLMVEK